MPRPTNLLQKLGNFLKPLQNLRIKPPQITNPLTKLQEKTQSFSTKNLYSRYSKHSFNSTPHLALKKFLIFAVAIFSLGASTFVASVGEDVNFLLNLKKAIPSGRYLVLFQNNTELRPTGGFIGSFMVVDINKISYKVVEFEGNIHRRDGIFTRENTVEPPKPLNEIYNKWAMRGANWDPDFENSAKQILWFFKREGGYDVDGVIAVNATVARDMLEILGSINTPTGLEVNHYNFLSDLQQEVERNYYKQESNIIENESKSVLKDIMGEMILRAKEPKNIVKVAKLIQKQIKEKHILFYNLDSSVDQMIQKLGWGGRLTDVETDYLHINNAGIVRAQYLDTAKDEAPETVSNKSSLNVGQKSFLEITENGNNLHHRLYIERTHTGTGQWPDFHNHNYARVLIPKDAQLIGATYNDNAVDNEQIIKEDFGDKTSYGIDFNTRVGQTSSLEVKYLTPVYKNWQLIYEKQPGILNEYLRVDYKGKTIFDGVVTKNIKLDGK